jgi:hypothetical protein
MKKGVCFSYTWPSSWFFRLGVERWEGRDYGEGRDYVIAVAQNPG